MIITIRRVEEGNRRLAGASLAEDNKGEYFITFGRITQSIKKTLGKPNFGPYQPKCLFRTNKNLFQFFGGSFAQKGKDRMTVVLAALLAQPTLFQTPQLSFFSTSYKQL